MKRGVLIGDLHSGEAHICGFWEDSPPRVEEVLEVVEGVDEELKRAARSRAQSPALGQECEDSVRWSRQKVLFIVIISILGF